MPVEFLKKLYRSIPYLRELPRTTDTLMQIRQTLDGIREQVELHRSFEISKFQDFELSQHPRYSHPKRLLKYAFQASSQNGEDGIIREIFNRIGTTDRTFVEIGIGDGNENNTAFLLSQGWSGYWIDGSSKFEQMIQSYQWARDSRIKGISAMVTQENAAGLLDGLGVPEEFDLLSLDIDQNTYHVWKALERYKPRVVVVEYNAAFPPDVAWAIPYNPSAVWNTTQNFGASLKAFELLGSGRGYNLVGCDFVGINAFFVRQDLCGEHFLAPYSAENHYEPLRYHAHQHRGHPLQAFDLPGL